MYADYITVFESLTNEEAGMLFKHILRYVNDLDPELDDRLLKILFEPIKQQMKRDLNKWEGKKETRVESGRAGGVKSGEVRRSKMKQNEANEANPSILKQTQANEPVNVNANVNANVNVNANESESRFWENESERKRPLAECLGIAMNDEGWVKKNKTNKSELQTFNDYLEKTGETEKTLIDYKKHFANLKMKHPEKVKNQSSTLLNTIHAIKGQNSAA